MLIEGLTPAPLNTVQDGLMQVIWSRRAQTRIFETLINVMASGIPINPDISKRIDELTSDYIDLVIPGSKATKAENDRQFAEKTSKTMAEVAKLLASGGSGKINKKVIL